jgi:hypothetical protein
VRVLYVLNVAYSFTELALGYVVGLAFASLDILDLSQFKVNLLVTSFVAVSAFCDEIPVFIWRKSYLTEILHVAGDL